MALNTDYSAIFSEMFAARFESEYQAMGKLGNVLDPAYCYMNVNDNKVNVPQATPIDMVPVTSYQANLAAQDITVRNIQLTFEQKYAKQAIGELEMKNFHPNAISMLVKQQVLGVKRYEDHKIISALDSASVSPIVAASNMTTEVFTEARTELGKNNATGRFYMLMHWNNYKALLGDTQFTSSLFNKQTPLNNPGVFTVDFLDFTIIVYGDVLDEQTGANLGLPLASGVRTCYAFSNTSLVYGSQVEIMPRVVPVPQELRYEVITAASLGCVPYDEKGIVKISCTE
jgi:hypothetical protein